MDSRTLYNDFAKALHELADALKTPADNNVIRAGCIQYYEFCFELAWKTMKAIAQEQGVESCVSPKATLKYAFKVRWVDDETVWLQMLAARNRMSHTYNAADALSVYEQLPAFEESLGVLSDRLRDVLKAQ